jgi:hypothetical protein
MDRFDEQDEVRPSLAFESKAFLSPSYSSIYDVENIEMLTSVLLYYLDMEEIYLLYDERNYKIFENKSSLDLLAERFNLPKADTFAELLDSYDRTYATVRSYSYPDLFPETIICNACLEGNIQAVVFGLENYSDLRNKFVYNTCAMYAAERGHKVIVDMMLDLGADDYRNILRGGCISGNFDIVLEALDKGDISPVPDDYKEAARGGHLNIIKYLLKVNNYPFKEYDVSSEEDEEREHFDAETEYLQKIRDTIGQYGAEGGHEDVVELAVRLGYDEKNIFNLAIKRGRMNIFLKYINKFADDKNMMRKTVKKLIRLGDIPMLEYILNNGYYNISGVNLYSIFLKRNKYTVIPSNMFSYLVERGIQLDKDFIYIGITTAREPEIQAMLKKNPPFEEIIEAIQFYMMHGYRTSSFSLRSPKTRQQAKKNIMLLVEYLEENDPEFDAQLLKENYIYL